MNENNNLIFESDNQNVESKQTTVSESTPIVAQKNQKGNKGLIIILILIIIGLTGFIVCDKFIATDDTKEEEKQTTEVEETTKKEETNKTEDATEKKEETTTVQKTDEEIVKELYLEKLKEPRTTCKITDYRVDIVKVITGTERQQIIDADANSNEKYYQNTSDKDIFATITFSEKYENINEAGCLAGNGELEGDWLSNQTRVLYIKYENGSYSIKSSGTGW